MRYRPSLGSLSVVVFLAGTLLAPGNVWATPSLWVGSDGAGFYYHIDTSGNLLSGPFFDGIPGETTGIAFDGANLWTSSFEGPVTEHNADGTGSLTTINPPLPNASEDMAWDSKRGLLWRITHNSPFVQAFDRSGNLVFQYALPTSEAGFGNDMGGLGLAYDPGRDLLYASFCHAGCSSLATGIVLSVNPNDGSSSVMFLSDYGTGGLAYDAGADRLWVGDYGVLRYVELNGVVENTITLPFGGNFPDGLELVSEVPEPGTMTLLGAGLLGLVGRRRRTVHRS
jgi:hypothetical protein